MIFDTYMKVLGTMDIQCGSGDSQAILYLYQAYTGTDIVCNYNYYACSSNNVAMW